ncbi:GH3 auxin-responsive promoter [Candidatus Ornithobacterium hominis]|uniref:GH3 auxin-responsive promoter family protein n=1 Tax=Candidatus Ornithobacterium hominis TaxID=2497989 RepID=UPI000E5C4D05|nr:GH3 auxin-responsive promoter family protein [Candidatus Ornithobacterium hominis]SZD71674.1 GH3 auxin-responsive promoter [Candidatus Ornithobacterium hominis]
MLKKFIAKIFARYIVLQEKKWMAHPVEAQEKVFAEIIRKAKNTEFGKKHYFGNIKNHQDFVKNVPIQDYENIKPYIDRIRQGELNVLWPGKPKYWAKTSGTTSGEKYIPISRESIPYHIEAARNALLFYIQNKGNANFVNGKMIFLQGNPELKEERGIQAGRLSGISAHYVPSYLQKNRLPSWETNTIENWEEKVDRIVDETHQANMTLISGIPPWMIMYFERLRRKSNQTLTEMFPQLQLIVTGGVNYNPYRQKIDALLGEKIDVIQTYPASEGFIAYQDQLDSEDLLLLLSKDIFYEFIPVEEYFDENPTRIGIAEVEKDVNYALILTTKAGLFAYSIGDTIRFTSLAPYRIRVTGRIKHFTSAFGEHVIGQEVETAIAEVLKKMPAEIKEFHVAPQVNPLAGLPYHEWLVEFEKEPEDLEKFSLLLDEEMRRLNTYYDDLIHGKILKPLKISIVQAGGFHAYLKSIGKLGGQFKPPRLANDRNFADGLSLYIK